MAALTEFAHLWTTRLSRQDQEKFIDFEKEFRKGYKLEKAGDRQGALVWYRKLEKGYADLPQASKLASLQIEKLESDGKNKSGASQAPPPWTVMPVPAQPSRNKNKERGPSRGGNP
jgi:hypothetical protein